MTGEGQAQFLEVGVGDDSRRIAYLARVKPGVPGLFWLSGFKSDMASTKAQALADYAAARGLGATRFDYSGHGLSSGRFEDGTIGRWLEEAVAVFAQRTLGPQVVIGSSMGGHIALLLLKTLMADHPDHARRVKSLVLIAPAWDMTEELIWQRFSSAQREQLMSAGVVHRPSAYGEPYAITRNLIEDGRKHLLARQPFDPGRPVLILQGLLDPDVPSSHTRQLLDFIEGGWAEIEEVPDGEHRLSRPEDLERLFGLVGRAVVAARA